MCLQHSTACHDTALWTLNPCHPEPPGTTVGPCLLNQVGWGGIGSLVSDFDPPTQLDPKNTSTHHLEPTHPTTWLQIFEQRRHFVGSLFGCTMAKVLPGSVGFPLSIWGAQSPAPHIHSFCWHFAGRRRIPHLVLEC